MRLRWHLVLLVLITLAPLPSFFAFMVYERGTAYRAGVERELLRATRAVGAALDDYFDATIRNLQDLATSEHLDLGRLPDSEDETRRAEDLAITHQQSRWLARVYVIMGKLRGRQGDENGFVFFEQAIELCRGGEPARRLEADVYREYARFRTTMGDRHEARAYLERARELLEPFGDEVARERIDQDLRQLDVWLLTDGAPSAPNR